MQFIYIHNISKYKKDGAYVLYIGKHHTLILFVTTEKTV